MFVLSLAILVSALPHDWPCWRGPERNGVSRETSWRSVGRAQPLWTRNVGLGHSCPSVADGRLYTLGFDEASGNDVLWCLDAVTGEELWTVTTPAERMSRGHSGGTLTTPAVAAGRVWVTNRVGLVRCLSAEDGEVLWSRDLARVEGVQPTDYGFGGSPLVLAERLIVNVNRTLALDPWNGETLWATAPHLAMYSTPQRVELLGEENRLLVFGKDGLIALDEESGAELARFPWRKGETTVNASTPVVVAEDRVFLSSGYGHGAALVAFGETGGAEALWETKAMRTRMSGCVLVQGHLYGFDETMLKCLGLDGKERWRKRGLGLGALSAAGDRLLVVSSKGELVVVAADPARYTELSRAEVVPPGTLWTSPVLAHGLVYARNGAGDLACLDHRE